MFARGHKLGEALVLVTRHCAIAPPFEGKILLKVGVQVLFQRQVPHEAHPADAAVEFHAFVDFSLGRLAESRPNWLANF